MDKDAGGIEKGLGKGAGGVLEELFSGDDLGGVRNVFFFFGRSVRGDDDLREKFLCDEGKGKKAENDSLHRTIGRVERF